jgi:hypothetical protein
MRMMTSVLLILHAFVATGLIDRWITHEAISVLWPSLVWLIPIMILALQTYIVREYFLR